MSEKGDAGSTSLGGWEESTIDEKGRLLVSKKKRERLGNPCVLTLGYDSCLVAYSQEEWAKFEKRIHEADPLSLARIRFEQLWYEYYEDGIRFDGQGRLTIPFRLRSKGFLKQKVVIVGSHTFVEFWDPGERVLFEQNRDAYKPQRREEMVRAYREMRAGL